MNDKPVKQQSAADYLGLTKDNIRALIAHHGVVRHGPGEGKVRVSDCFKVILAEDGKRQCPTCLCTLDVREEVADA